MTSVETLWEQLHRFSKPLTLIRRLAEEDTYGRITGLDTTAETIQGYIEYNVTEKEIGEGSGGSKLIGDARLWVQHDVDINEGDRIIDGNNREYTCLGLSHVVHNENKEDVFKVYWLELVAKNDN